MRLPARMDGGPHQMIEPGATWTPQWTVDQPAASLWYHPHQHGATARHVYRGLAGMFVIDDEAESRLDLPRRYGVDDLPIIVQDRKFHDDGTLDTSVSLFQSEGIVGDTVLVNGTPGPYFDVTTRTVRLRLLNGSNTRPYTFVFDDDREFAVIGTDGGLLPTPVPARSLPLSPGERAEIVVTFRPGERVRLRSAPTDTEIWSVTNSGDAAHNFHIHDVQFQILDVDGRAPPPHQRGGKDTVWVPRNQTVRLIMRFSHHTDTAVPYMYHCHLLRHEDEGMMGQFLVVPPGTSTDPADYSTRTGGHH